MDTQWIEFINTTQYNKKTLAALNQLAGETVLKKARQRNRFLFSLLGFACLGIAVFLFITNPLKRSIAVVIALYSILLLYLGLFSKRFQMWSSLRQLPSGVKSCTYEFGEEEVLCRTEVNETTYSYRSVASIAENSAWYALFFDADHGIIIDKEGFTQGDPAAFKAFLGRHTMLPIQEVK